MGVTSLRYTGTRRYTHVYVGIFFFMKEKKTVTVCIVHLQFKHTCMTQKIGKVAKTGSFPYTVHILWIRSQVPI
jgi:hypothetical protein